MPHRKVWVHHTAILGLLLLSTLALQGCVAIVWLGAVGIDQTRTSNIEFLSFENSWMVTPQERQAPGLVKSITVMPFVGDSVMAERWIAVFREMTDLHVVSQSDTTRYGVPDHEQIGLAQKISTESHVDCVLFGNVAGQESKKSFTGFKESSSQRLYLHLISASGTLMWKTELSYTIVMGAKNLDEEMVTKALLTHVKAHAHELGLAELGATTMQAPSRSLRDTSANQVAPPLSGSEHP